MALTEAELRICNRALFALGEEMVVELTTANSKPSRLCDAAYPAVRDAVTRRLPWNCVRRRTRLASAVEPPLFGWDHAYTLPADFIRLYHIVATGDAAYVVEGEQLLTNQAAPLDCIYIGRLDDPTRADPLMAEIIAWSLAAEIGRAIVQDEQAVARVETKLASLWQEAEAANRSEHGFHEWSEAQWLALTGDAATGTILNRALVALGINTADRPEENVIRAQLLAQAYPSVRDGVTRRLPWNCARTRASLTADAMAPIGWSRSFTLPADFIRLYELPAADDTEWVVENGKLLTDAASPLEIVYVKRLALAAEIDPQMAETIAYALAAEAGPALDVKDPQAIARCETKLAAMLAEAAAINAAEHARDELDPARYLVLAGMTDPVAAEICNEALVYLGVPATRSAQEIARRARLAIDAYPAARDGVTRRAAWNCARTRIKLVADAQPPNFEWQHAYTLPTDFIRMVESNSNQFAEWRIENGVLLSDQGPEFELLYIRRLTDASQMDPLLREAVALALAARIGPALKPDDPQAINRVAKWCEDRIRLAASASAQESSTREWEIDIWLQARF